MRWDLVASAPSPNETPAGSSMCKPVSLLTSTYHVRVVPYWGSARSGSPSMIRILASQPLWATFQMWGCALWHLALDEHVEGRTVAVLTDDGTATLGGCRIRNEAAPTRMRHVLVTGPREWGWLSWGLNLFNLSPSHLVGHLRQS